MRYIIPLAFCAFTSNVCAGIGGTVMKASDVAHSIKVSDYDLRDYERNISFGNFDIQPTEEYSTKSSDINENEDDTSSESR